LRIGQTLNLTPFTTLSNLIGVGLEIFYMKNTKNEKLGEPKLKKAKTIIQVIGFQEMILVMTI